MSDFDVTAWNPADDYVEYNPNHYRCKCGRFVGYKGKFHWTDDYNGFFYCSEKCLHKYKGGNIE